MYVYIRRYIQFAFNSRIMAILSKKSTRNRNKTVKSRLLVQEKSKCCRKSTLFWSILYLDSFMYEIYIVQGLGIIVIFNLGYNL